MTFKEVVLKIVSDNPNGISPPNIQQIIEKEYPEYFKTESHVRNVEKGHYTDLHHALKAQVYGLVKRSDDFYCDTSVKPYLVSLLSGDMDDIVPEPFCFESTSGKVYILKTGTFTKESEEIIKIGHTCQDIMQRISQLYTTGVPFQFSVYKTYEVNNHIELESAIHKLLAKYRLNKSREFFTEKALPFIDMIVEIHNSIQNTE